MSDQETYQDDETNHISPRISSHYPLRDSQIDGLGDSGELDDNDMQESQGEATWNPSSQSNYVASSSFSMSNQIPNSDTHASTSNILFDVYEPIGYPKLDYELAHMNQKRLLTAYMINVKFHNEKPKVDLSSKGLAILSKPFRDLIDDDQTAFLDLLNNLNSKLVRGLSSCMHYSLLNILMEDNSFWPAYANLAGITRPMKKPSMFFGESGFYYLGHTILRSKAAQAIDDIARKCEKEIEGTLLAHSLNDCSRFKDAFGEAFATRFRDNLDNEAWFKKLIATTMDELVTGSQPDWDVTTWPLHFKNTLKHMVDSLSNFLILFALPEAQNNNKQLLRYLFELKKCKTLTVHIALFDIVVHIDADSVPVAEPSRTTPITHASAVAMSTPIVAPMQKESRHSHNTPGSAMKVSFDTTNNKRSIQETTPSTSSTTSSAPKRTKEAGTPVQPVNKNKNCKYDLIGCTNGDCTRSHVVTYTLKCSDMRVAHRHYKCLQTDCKFLHDTIATPTTSPDNHENGGDTPQRQRSTSRKRQRQQVPTALAPTALAPRTYSQWGLANKVKPDHPVSTTDTYSSTPNTTSLSATTRERKRRRRGPRVIHKMSLTVDHNAEQRIQLLRSICTGITNIGVNVLHDCTISLEERLVLSLGLNFIPPPRKNLTIILTEALNKFKRRVRIKKHFAAQPDYTSLDNSVESLLHLRINKTLSLREAEAAFNPDIFKCPIEGYLNTISNNIAAITTMDSLVPHQEHKKWLLLYSIASKLKNRKDIIIKPADKNLGVTVMNRDWYIAKATSNKYLGDTTTYLQITQPLLLEPILYELDSICKEQEWLSTTKIAKLQKDLKSDVLLNKVKLCRIYFMPKLHKDLVDIPLRPICASQGWITYWASVYIHLTLFSLLRLIPSYITIAHN
jgi:hypothetical protein